MMPRTRVMRCLALVWATLQLASPGVSAMAHGLAARDNASGPLVHIEATTSASCPAVHSVDCAVCRYLTTSAAGDAAPPTIDWGEAARCGLTPAATTVQRVVAIALPHGRAPPLM